MPIQHGDLWKPAPHPAIYTVTTNASINSNGELVMGRGAAYQATQRIPGIAKEAAEVVSAFRGYFTMTPESKREISPYGFLVVRYPRPDEGKYGFGIFQVKETWDQPAQLPLIQLSMNTLRQYAHWNKGVTIRLNFPGIGNGKLSRSEVQPILRDLPENIHIFYKEPYRV